MENLRCSDRTSRRGASSFAFRTAHCVGNLFCAWQLSVELGRQCGKIWYPPTPIGLEFSGPVPSVPNSRPNGRWDPFFLRDGVDGGNLNAVNVTFSKCL